MITLSLSIMGMEEKSENPENLEMTSIIKNWNSKERMKDFVDTLYFMKEKWKESVVGKKVKDDDFEPNPLSCRTPDAFMLETADHEGEEEIVSFLTPLGRVLLQEYALKTGCFLNVIKDLWEIEAVTDKIHQYFVWETPDDRQKFHHKKHKLYKDIFKEKHHLYLMKSIWGKDIFPILYPDIILFCVGTQHNEAMKLFKELNKNR